MEKASLIGHQWWSMYLSPLPFHNPGSDDSGSTPFPESFVISNPLLYFYQPNKREASRCTLTFVDSLCPALHQSPSSEVNMQLGVSEMQLSIALGPPSGAHAPLHRAVVSRRSHSGHDARSPFKIPTAPLARQPNLPLTSQYHTVYDTTERLIPALPVPAFISMPPGSPQ